MYISACSFLQDPPEISDSSPRSSHRPERHSPLADYRTKRCHAKIDKLGINQRITEYEDISTTIQGRIIVVTHGSEAARSAVVRRVTEVRQAAVRLARPLYGSAWAPCRSTWLCFGRPGYHPPRPRSPPRRVFTNCTRTSPGAGVFRFTNQT